MKKFLIVFGAAVVVFLMALILIPIFFKGKIVELVKTEANKNLNARLEFADLDLSLLKNFPNATLEIEKLVIINNPPFAGDTLVALKNFAVTLNIMSLLRGQTLEVRSITLDTPRLKLQALEDGAVNWNIAKTGETEAPAPESATPEDFHLALKEHTIKNAQITYDDRAANMSVAVQALDHAGSGDFSQQQFKLRTQTRIEALSVSAGGIGYLNKVKTQLKADLDVDAAKNKVTLLENELQLNNLILRFDGSVAMALDSTALDLRFNAPQTEFKSILSLIPAIYTRDFAALKAAGQISLQGEAKGVYRENQLPAFNLQLLVTNGMFQYPQLPSAVNNVNLDLNVNNPGGDPDQTTIHLKKLHVELGREPFDATLLVKTPVSDPHIAAMVKGQINLGEIKNFIPLSSGTELAGLLTSDLRVAGNLSSLEKGQYQKFQAAGNLSVNDISYRSAAVPEKIVVKQARLTLTPENARLSDLECVLGQSDLRANGTLDNILPYLMKGETLKGTLALTSNFFDLNPWLEGESQQLTAVELPAKIEFTLNSAFQEVRFDKLSMKNVRGMLLLKDRTLHLMDLNMNLLGGSLLANGAYSTPPNQPPHSFFELKVDNFNIGQTFESFLTVQKFAPIAKSVNGNFGASLTIRTDLEQTLIPVWNTLNSRGALRIGRAVIEDFTPLTRMSTLLKLEKLQRVVVENITPSYKIRDGRFYLEPLSFSAENINFVISGSNGIDQVLDYSVKIRVPSRDLNQQANAAISQLANKKIDLLQGEYVDLVGYVRGNIADPEIKFSTADVVKGAAAQVTSALQQQVQTQKAALADTVNVEIEKRKQEVEQFKQAALDSARRETERLKEEAKKKLKKLLKP
ncbi:MAG: AsmA family protein [candidate division KSB1 bacterium]|nr:AsmA family protein [candidate division KSB1 bacterium]MDZ7367263.1 AsmA family protein [candidate division KSB1 bacterium]MDZ7405898.1 AsmA family protein [candidate division KSB1 bacterium]